MHSAEKAAKITYSEAAASQMQLSEFFTLQTRAGRLSSAGRAAGAPRAARAVPVLLPSEGLGERRRQREAPAFCHKDALTARWQILSFQPTWERSFLYQRTAWSGQRGSRAFDYTSGLTNLTKLA